MGRRRPDDIYSCPATDRTEDWRAVLADLGFTFEAVADGWRVSMGGSVTAHGATPLKAWNRWKEVADAA